MLVRAMGWLTPSVLVALTLLATFTIFPHLFRFCFFGKRRFWISTSLVLIFLIFPPPPFQIISQSWNLSDTPSPKKIIEEVRKNIFLAERYGGEWHGTNKAEILFLRKAGKPDVLRKPYNPNLSSDPTLWPRLTPFLVHNVRGLVIHRATIYLKIPHNVVVTALPGHINPTPAQQWTLADTDSQWHHYYTVVAKATETMGAGVIQSLALKFPGPGTYQIQYIVSLENTTPIAGLGDIKGQFQFEIIGTND